MSELSDLYQQLILDHARERHGAGLAERFDAESVQRNRLCGDEVTVRVRMSGETVTQVSWTGEGCSISQASASVLSDLVTGRSRAEARVVGEAFREMMRARGAGEPDEDVLGDAVAFAGVGRHANRVACAMLGWVALTDALARTATTEETP